MEHLLILLVGGLIVLVRKLFLEGGLEKMLGKLDNDLNRPSDELRRTTPPPMTRPLATSLTPEEEKMRKFREALGLPVGDELPPRPRGIPPVPPIISQKTAPDQRARRERERIERRLAEKRRAQQAAQPPPPPIVVTQNAEDTAVSKYFQLDNFNQPTIQQEKIPVMSPVIESDFFKTLEKHEAVSVASETRLSEIFGPGTDLRRLILAQEILGRPKSLQNA